MNLLALLLSTMTAPNSVNNLSKKSNISKELIYRFLPLAIPLLIRYMTKNASSAGGAQSLLGALAQHTNKRTIAEQIQDADEQDGGKIIRHILGDDSDKAVKELATRSGMNTAQVIKLLSLLAPAILSVLSASSGAQPQAQPAQVKPASDFSALASMFGAASPAQTQQTVTNAGPGSSLLGSLLGIGGGQPQAAPAQQLSEASPANPLAALFGAMPGLGTQQTAVQENSINGTELLSLLAQLAKK